MIYICKYIKFALILRILKIIGCFIVLSQNVFVSKKFEYFLFQQFMSKQDSRI